MRHPFDYNIPVNGVDLKKIVDNFEGHIINQALERTDGNKKHAAILLGMNRTTLVENLRRRGMIEKRKKKTVGPHK